MATNIKLTSPKLRVVMGNPDDESTWTEHEVQTMGRDSTAAETLMGVQKYGRTTDHPVLFMVAMAYYAMLRNGAFAGPWDDFQNAYIEITGIGEDEAFPTEAGAEPA